MRLICCVCGKAVSTEVPESTVVRAVMECPECVQKQPDHDRTIAAQAAEIERLNRIIRSAEAIYGQTVGKLNVAEAEIERLNENRCAQVAALKAVLDKYRDAVNLVSLGMYRKTALDAESCEDVRAFINDAIAFDKATLGQKEPSV